MTGEPGRSEHTGKGPNFVMGDPSTDGKIHFIRELILKEIIEIASFIFSNSGFPM